MGVAVSIPGQPLVARSSIVLAGGAKFAGLHNYIGSGERAS
jgi:hypothetical protein